MTTTDFGRDVNERNHGTKRPIGTSSKDTSVPPGTRCVPTSLPNTPPCRGLHKLFDSTDIRDHWLAKAVCSHCPLIDACTEHLVAVQRAGGASGQPEGTWAGQLLHAERDRSEFGKVARKRVSDRQIEREDAMYTDDQARIASNDFKAGRERSEWTRTGHRVWQRRKKRAQREKGVA